MSRIKSKELTMLLVFRESLAEILGDPEAKDYSDRITEFLDCKIGGWQERNHSQGNKTTSKAIIWLDLV